MVSLRPSGTLFFDGVQDVFLGRFLRAGAGFGAGFLFDDNVAGRGAGGHGGNSDFGGPVEKLRLVQSAGNASRVDRHGKDQAAVILERESVSNRARHRQLFDPRDCRRRFFVPLADTEKNYCNFFFFGRDFFKYIQSRVILSSFLIAICKS